MHLREATRRRQYERRIAAILRDVGRLEAGTVRDLFRFLDDLRAQTVADLALTPQDAGTWPAARLAQLLTEIDQARDALRQRLAATLQTVTGQAWALGATAQTTALDLPVSISTTPMALSTDQIAVARAMHADLVKRVSDDFRTRAAREITLVVAGGQSPQQAMASVGGLLRTQPGRMPRALGTIAAQAERIVRTETMTAFNTADRLADERLQQDGAELRKWWDAANDARTRPSHREVERRYQPGGSEGPIPLGADFVVGGEKAQGPHDPRLSARQSVNCRCVRMVWSPDWASD